MSRSVPWRNKPTNLITQMIPVANEYKLYLVHQTGPTSFVFKDDNDNKFKVSIGSVVTCSCGIVQNDHCIHTLYVMLKKFKVPPINPIIWQASYLDSELQGLVQLKYQQKKKEEKKKHQFKKAIQNNNNQNNQDLDDFPELGEDQTCPICYEQMNDSCYSTCKTCKKSLHTKCFKIWTKHKQQKGTPVTCPMCRSQFQNPMVIIFKDLQKWQARFQTHKGSTCKGCGVKNIKGLIYKCLLCSGYDLCRLCFEGNQHPQHERFVVKHMATQNWKWAAVRIKKTKKQLFQPIKQVNTKQLNSIEDEQEIVDLFPSLKEYNYSNQTTELGIVGNEIIVKQMCFKCKTSGNQSMKRLNCGHSVHEQCLKAMFHNKEYICQIDNKTYCPGYFEAMGIKVVKSKTKNVQCVVLKNQEEISRIKSNLNNLQINGVVTKTKMPQQRNQSLNSNLNKSKDNKFRIMKKTLFEKKNEEPTLFSGNNFGMIMITGLGQHTQNAGSQIRQQTIVFPPHPKGRSNINSGNIR